MTVETKNIDQEQEKIMDDISDVVVVSEPKEEEMDPNKLAALKAKMAQKDKKEDMPPRIVEKIDRSINFGIIGSGQAGGRLAEYWHSLGYKAVAINTATQDLEYIKMPESNKLLLEYGLGGASKDRTIGHEAASLNKNAIYSLIVEKLTDVHMFVFCTSLGGGSGSGSIDVIIDLLSSIGKPIIVITVLPMTSEDVQTKSNTLEALSKLSKLAQEKVIHNLIVVDNAKIESIFSDVGQMDFYPVSNKAIVEPLDVFNTYSSKPSDVKGLDPTDLLKVFIDGEGLSLYGCMPVYDYKEDTAIAEAIVSNLDSGLLASGFDLKKAKYVGVMVLASKNTWKTIPSSSINYAMSVVQETAGMPLAVFKGIYEADMEDNVVKVYSFFSGLALPDPRIDELKKEVASQKTMIKSKEVTRNISLTIDTGESETVSAVEKIKQKIQQRKSKFGQFNQSIIDRRKK